MTWGHDLPLREVTIAEAVRTAGHVTGHFGKWHLGGIEHAAGGTGRGLPESFDAQPRHPGNQGFDEWWSAGNNYDIGYEFIYHNGKQVSPRAGDTSNVLMDVALKWIGKQAAARKPFLAVIWFPSPHAPHIAARECAAPYAKHGTKKVDYYGELAGVDHAMGRLRQALRDLNIADDTMLWFCSDNGAASPGSTGGLPGIPVPKQPALPFRRGEETGRRRHRRNARRPQASGWGEGRVPRIGQAGPDRIHRQAAWTMRLLFLDERKS
jgi:arylsulfatase A-like enzyme